MAEEKVRAVHTLCLYAYDNIDISFQFNPHPANGSRMFSGRAVSMHALDPRPSLPSGSGGLHSTVRAGGCAIPTGFAASAGAKRHGYAPQPDDRPMTKFENRGIKFGHVV
jgi:hypothetical protein